MKKYLLIVFVFVLSCNANISEKVSDKLINRLEILCHNSDSCEIKISEITNFDWDRVVITISGASSQDIDDLLRFHYPFFEETTSSIIFIKGDTIIYHENIYTPDPEKGDKFGFAFNVGRSFTRKEAVFKVNKNNEREEVFYSLKPVY